MNDDRDLELREELLTCKHFLFDSDLVRGRQHVLSYSLKIIYPTFLKEKAQHIFESLQCALKLIWRSDLFFVTLKTENIVTFVHLR